ncbi:MAG: hypothetical protein QM831_37615 [Kofleriaceae bacterium]
MRGFLPLVCLLGLVVSCGSSDNPPGPLANHFQDMYIAALPLDQKQSIVQAQQNWNVSQMENANGDAQVKEAESQLHQGRNDAKAAALAVDSANSNKKSADASNDMTRINTATKDLATAKDVQKAADARVKYLESYLTYLRRYQRYTQENMYYREAEYENAKAKLAQSNNINPKGINYPAFPKQLDDRRSRTEGAKSKAESAKSSVNDVRNNWIHAQETADRENGHAGVYWDPMAPKVQPTT